MTEPERRVHLAAPPTSRTPRWLVTAGALAVLATGIVAVRVLPTASPTSSRPGPTSPPPVGPGTTPTPTASPQPSHDAQTVPDPAFDGLLPMRRPPLVSIARHHFLTASATFLSSLEGFVVGTRCGQESCRTVVAHTRDGARTWLPDAPLAVDLTPTGQDHFGAGQVDLVAADRRHLLAGERRGSWAGLQASADGGASWFTPVLPGVGRLHTAEVVATNEAFWVLATDRIGSDAPWQLFRLELGATRARRAGAYPEYSALTANPTAAGTAGATAFLTAGRDIGPPVAQVLSRSGVVRRPLPSGAFGHVSVARDGRLLLSTQNGAAAGSGPKSMWVSVDLARHWTALPDPPFAGDLTDLVQVSPGRYLLSTASGDTELTLTADGGRSWQGVLQFGGGGDPFTDLVFPDTKTGYVVFAGPTLASALSGSDLDGADSAQYTSAVQTLNACGLYTSTDAGRTWWLVRPPS